MNWINPIYRFIALTLAFVMLTTSAGFSVDMHYCQGQLKSFSFVGKAKTCHDMAEAAPMKNCPHHKKMLAKKEGCSIDKKDCCSNQTFVLQSDQNPQIQTTEFVVNQQIQQFVIACVAVLFTNDFGIENDATFFTYYQPPHISRDIPVLFESFLL